MRYLFVLAVLCGCASPDPQLVKSEQDEAGRSYIECLSKSARAIDDGVSDAYTVAMAVRSLCRQESRRYALSFTSEMNANARRMFLAKAERDEVERAASVVLKERQIRGGR